MSLPPLSLFEGSVSASLAASPTASVKSVKSKLFKKGFFFSRFLARFELRRLLITGRDWSEENLEEVKKRGNFTNASPPSKLFLKIYADVLTTLTRDPLAGNVSPSLLGSTGVVVASIVSTIPDIMEHYRRCILLAEKEIVLQTNYWQPSNSVNTISSALRELSAKRVKEGKESERIVVKIMWDRGSYKQIISNHVKVDVETYTAQDLPPPNELPGLELEVINFHRPILGTFHQKLLIVDQKLALLNSNNIQDRPNVEMMVHLEGAIVDSLYDTALISWSKELNPPLPCLLSLSPSSSSTAEFTFGNDNVYVAGIDLVKRAKETREGFSETVNQVMGEHEEAKSSRFKMMGDKVISNNREVAGMDHISKVKSNLNSGTKKAVDSEVDDSILNDFKPILLHSAHRAFPIALVNRKPHGAPGHQDVRNPQCAAWLGALLYAKKNVQTPTLNARPIKDGILQACRRGIKVELWLDPGFNDQSESLLFQGGTNENVVVELFAELDESVKNNLSVYWYTAIDQKKPINALVKSRNIHVKLMTVDGHVGIQGNGNQDSQSWFHSQECNIMVDSKQIVEDWMNMIRSNQSTGRYGKVDNDGIWRGEGGLEIMQPVKKAGFFSAVMGLI